MPFRSKGISVKENCLFKQACEAWDVDVVYILERKFS